MPAAYKFSPGKVAFTPGAIEAMMEADVDFRTYLGRHLSGDWGDVPPEDAAENDFSVENDFRILSAYALPITDVKIWIITERDRSYTTFLLPSEY